MDISKRKLSAIAALALFTYIFLTAEFRFDIRIGLLAGAGSVVVAQGLILGASVIGFVGAAPLARRLGPSAPRYGTIVAAAVAAVGVVGIEIAPAANTLQAIGCVSFLALGALGVAAHLAFARAFDGDPRLATGAGASYAGGILLQFATNLVVPTGAIEALVLLIATAALTACTARETVEDDPMATDSTAWPGNVAAPLVDSATRPQPLGRALWTVALIVILACMFSTLDNVVTLSNAHGTIAVQT